MSDYEDQLKRMREGRGFIAALDQSGGSTPKALRNYGITEGEYSNESEMFDLVQAMRARIISNPAFDERILGAILFEVTMDREVERLPTATYLWQKKRIVPFLKVDEGMEEQANGVQLMSEMAHLDELLCRARKEGVFGTKMRSVIHLANESGVQDVVAQQFDYARRIAKARFVPIIEPEVSIKSAEKAVAEELLRDSLLRHLKTLKPEELVMFKLTLPESPGFYRELSMHPNVVRVAALSGGYERQEANARLAENPGMIASFSRAMLQDLRAQQSETEFTDALNQAVESIYQASIT